MGVDEMMHRVVITGVGAISAVGIGKENFWNGLLAGRNGVSEIESFDTRSYRTHRGGEVKDFRPIPGTEKIGRCSQFAVHAAREALGDAAIDWTAIPPFRTGLSLGTTMWESPSVELIGDLMVKSEFDSRRRQLVPAAVPDTVPASVARALGIRGPVNLITTACAAGNYALSHAAMLLRTGSVDIMLAGGSDPISRIAYTGFSSMMAIAPERCQPFDRNRKGMIPGEGCAVLVLERMETARKRGARIYAELAGYGMTNDAYHMTTPHPEACGATRAMTRALASASVSAAEVDYISAHGTGTPANDRVEALAMQRVFGAAARTKPASSIKSMLGHSMSAASALEAVACVLAIDRGMVPPTINFEEPDPECELDCIPNQAREVTVDVAISNAYAIGGHCSSIVLRRVGSARSGE
jgi:3-oxoacyl-[acyl-carrier-protein] synthase II